MGTIHRFVSSSQKALQYLEGRSWKQMSAVFLTPIPILPGLVVLAWIALKGYRKLRPAKVRSAAIKSDRLSRFP